MADINCDSATERGVASKGDIDSEEEVTMVITGEELGFKA